jgi:hypothetical protein
VTITPRHLPTFLASCQRNYQSSERPGHELTAIPAAAKGYLPVSVLAAIPLDEDGARKFFEDNFRPLRINRLGDTDGFLTGYYEPIIAGSRVPTGEFHGTALPAAAKSCRLLVGANLATHFRARVFSSGAASAAAKSCRTMSRAEIEDGALDGWHLEICWLHDPARRSIRADPGIGPDQDWKTAQSCASITIHITAGPTRRSAAFWSIVKAYSKDEDFHAEHPRLDGSQSRIKPRTCVA